MLWQEEEIIHMCDLCMSHMRLMYGLSYLQEVATSNSVTLVSDIIQHLDRCWDHSHPLQRKSHGVTKRSCTWAYIYLLRLLHTFWVLDFSKWNYMINKISSNLQFRQSLEGFVVILFFLNNPKRYQTKFDLGISISDSISHNSSAVRAATPQRSNLFACKHSFHCMPSCN